MDLNCSNSNLAENSNKLSHSEVPASSSSSSSHLLPSASDKSLVGSSKLIGKRIIRKITPLDPKKLQQAGLDRKIAEILSKQKSQQTKALTRTTTELTSFATPAGSLSLSSTPTSESTTALKAVASTVAGPSTLTKCLSKTNIHESAEAEITAISNKLKLPKITITGPEILTDREKRGLANLDPHQRLVHVKHLLNKKLLQKKDTEASDNPKTLKHLRPPTSLYDSPNYKLPTRSQKKKPSTTNLFCVLKEPAQDVTSSKDLRAERNKPPQKSPQDIARKLQFPTEIAAKFTDTTIQGSSIGLNKNINDIPKVSIKAGHIQQQNKAIPRNATKKNKQPQQSTGEGKIKQYCNIINNSPEAQSFPGETVKKHTINSSEIPKASIKTGQGQNQGSYSNLVYQQQKPPQQKFDFSEVSPLKIPFPTVNVPTQTPLPTIDSFKKHYPLMNSSYYDLQHKNGGQNDFLLSDYETTSSSFITSNLPNNAATNCLVVLENKVLTQDEMIDLTELRLSTSNLDTPGFIKPHKPIPEVVIKVENTDDYPISDVSNDEYVSHTLSEFGTMSEVDSQIKEMSSERIISTSPAIIQNLTDFAPERQVQPQNKDLFTERVVISNKQNKIIINAHKLKLPPEQLAALAKRIKEKSSVSSPASPVINQHHQQDIHILNIKADCKKTRNLTQAPKQMLIDINKQDDNNQSKQTDHIFNNDMLRKSFDATENEMAEMCKSSTDYSESAVEIVDQPLEAADCFSAVDFIAALSHVNPTTDDTNLELSPEELNLNASCAMNLSPIRIPSYPPCKATSITQKTSTPKCDNLLSSLQMGTIVIESSNGPETVLTNEVPNKSTDAKMTNKSITNLELFHNNILKEMEVKTPISNDGPMKQGDPKVGTDISSFPIESGSYNDGCSGTLIINQIESDCALAPVSLSTKSTDNIKKGDLAKSLKNADQSCHNITQIVLEPLKDPKTIDLTNVKVASDPNQINLIISNIKQNVNLNNAFVTTSTASNSKLKESAGFKSDFTHHSSNLTPEKDLKTQHIQFANSKIEVGNIESKNIVTSGKVISDQKIILSGKLIEEPSEQLELEKDGTNPSKSIASDVDIMIKLGSINSKSSDSEQSTTKKNIVQEGTETSKSGEKSSSNAITVKRISRFKKGKINLVQRNKTGKVLAKPKAEINMSFDNSANKDDKVSTEYEVVETNIGCTTSSNTEDKLEKEKSDSEIENEAHKLSNQTHKLTKEAELGKMDFNAMATSKDLHDVKATETFNININVMQNVHEPRQPTDYIGKKMFSQDSHTDLTQSPIGSDKSSQLQTNTSDQLLTEDSNNTSMNPLKASVKTPSDKSDSSSSPNKCGQEINLDVTSKKPIIGHQETQENISIKQTEHELTSDNTPATSTSDKSVKSTEVKDNIKLVKCPKKMISNQTEELNQKSKAILESMKGAKISLIDIAKHSPIKIQEVCAATAIGSSPKVSGKILKSNNSKKHKQDNILEECKQQVEDAPINKTCSANVKDSKVVTKLDEQKLLPNRRSSRSVSKNSESHTETPLSPASTKKRCYTRTLISDADLEFLPENADVKFKVSKSKPNERNTKCNTDTVSVTSATHKRKHRLYSKPAEAELENSSPLTKRTRYYSQTLDANVIITFDTLKSKTSCPKTNQPLEIEESYPNSTQDSKVRTPTKYRQKSRKTMEAIEQTPKSHIDNDSNDDTRDFDSIAKDCEESNEFLGFEENSNSSSCKNIQNNVKETEHDAKTTQGTLKSWLTTGKAISPTFDTMANTKRIQNEEEAPTSSASFLANRAIERNRFKKSAKHREETDISDDTSPADDEEDTGKRTTKNTNLKRGLKNVVAEKMLTENKKIKLNESMEARFNQPRNSRKNSDCNEKKCEKSEKSQPMQVKEFSTESAQSKKTAKCAENEHYDSEKDSSNPQRPASGVRKSQDNANVPNKKTKCIENYINSNCHDATERDKMLLKHKKKNTGEVKDTKLMKTTKENQNKHVDIPSKPNILKNESDISGATTQSVTNKKKRGRPKANSTKAQFSTSDETEEIRGDRSRLQMNSNKSMISGSSDDERMVSVARKCSLKRKLRVVDSDSDSTIATPSKAEEKDNFVNSSKPSLGLHNSETSTPNMSRKRKPNTEANFNPRLLLITKREQLDTDEIITQAKSGTGPIQCGLCLCRTQSPKWKVHLAEHYGVGWQVGEENLHIENRSVVLNCILNYIKSSECKALSCRMCKKVYRSALGILTHIEACGVQATRVECEFCRKDYAKTTLPIHIRSCYARNALQNETCGENLKEMNEKAEEVFGNSGRLKRNSTIKAENKLKALGAELEKVVDNAAKGKTEKDPKTRIRYVPPLQGDFKEKWCKEITKNGQGSCPKTRCKFTSDNIIELTEHLKNCKHIKTGYFCNFCRNRAFQNEKEAIEHVMKSHKNGRGRKKSEDSDCALKTSDEQSSDDNDLSEGEEESESDDAVPEGEDECDNVAFNKKVKKAQKTKTPYSRNLNQSANSSCRKEVFDGRFTDLNKEVLRKWKSFLKLNYSCEPLYTEFNPQYSVITNGDFNNYLPNQTVSMKFNFKTKKTLNATVGVPEKNIEWSELKRYESISDRLNTFFFLGASVKFCSWLPLPANVNEQYLAVVYRREMFKYIKFSCPKQHHNIVLIIKVTQNNKVPELSIHYGFIVYDGPIHHLSFLPSGGYDETSNRLGLVAVATVTSDIKVYSLPINVQLASVDSNCKSENIKLIDVKPCLFLNLDILHKKEDQHVLLNPQCLQICWSEFCGHQHIFASFSNGFVGIWDITNDSQQNLNRFIIDDVLKFAPINYIYIGEKGVKCFAVHYDTSGPRWLAASGAYRKFVIYDIKNFMQPTILKEEVNKNIMLSMDWCPLWETVLYSYCDTIPNNGRCVVAVNPTNVMFSQNKLDIMVCSVTQVHYTPLTNMCVTGLSNGDIVFLDTKELHYECTLSKKFGDRRMLYTMDIKQLNGEPLVRLTKGNQKNDTTKAPNDWLMYDDDYKEKYGLIFEPLLKLKENDRKTYLSENRCPPVNVIPLMRINTLRCNLNMNGKHLIALGYENGFIRLINFNKESLFSN